MDHQPDSTSTDDGIPNFGFNTPNGGGESTLVSSAAGAAGALAGWAISSIGKKVRSLIFVLRPPSYLPTSLRPPICKPRLHPPKSYRHQCRVKQNLQLAADRRHRLYPVVANLKECSWVATRPPFQAVCLEDWQQRPGGVGT